MHSREVNKVNNNVTDVGKRIPEDPDKSLKASLNRKPAGDPMPIPPVGNGPTVNNIKDYLSEFYFGGWIKDGDTDKDGKTTLDELNAIYSKMGGGFIPYQPGSAPPSQKTYYDLTQEDADKLNKLAVQYDAQFVLDQYDLNGDGVLSMSDLEKDAKAIMDHLDVDKNGVFDYLDMNAFTSTKSNALRKQMDDILKSKEKPNPNYDPNWTPPKA